MSQDGREQVQGFEVAPGVRQYSVWVPSWGASLTVLQTADGRRYYLVRQLCGLLGIVPQMQVRRLSEHAAMKRRLAMLPMQTERRGIQRAWGIEEHGIGFWWGTIQLDAVRPELRPVLLDLQEQIVDAADQVIRGQITADPMRAQLTAHDGRIASLARFTLVLEERIGRVEGVVFGPDDDGGEE